MRVQKPSKVVETDMAIIIACLGARLPPPELMFGYSLSESILTSRIDSGRSENLFLFVRITFKKTTKHKSLYLKINSNQINSI